MSKIETAKRYIDLHRVSEHWKWIDAAGVNHMSESDKYLTIYNRLANGVYGTVTDNAEHDSDSEETKAATEFAIEIDSHDSATGNPVIFEWCAE